MQRIFVTERTFYAIKSNKGKLFILGKNTTFVNIILTLVKLIGDLRKTKLSLIFRSLIKLKHT